MTTKPTAEVSVDSIKESLRAHAREWVKKWPQGDVLGFAGDSDEWIEQALQSHTTTLKGRVVEEIEELYQNESPMDSMTGEPVETYGYEENYNQAIKQAIDIITNIT